MKPPTYGLNDLLGSAYSAHAQETMKGLSSKHGISHATLFSTDAPRVTCKNLGVYISYTICVYRTEISQGYVK